MFLGNDSIIKFDEIIQVIEPKLRSIFELYEKNTTVNDKLILIK
jgi:hypothetical protein